MPLDKLALWLQIRTGAAATNLSMLDGFVTAVVAGPVSMDPPEWICPLLGIGIDAFNHGGAPGLGDDPRLAVRCHSLLDPRRHAPQDSLPVFLREPAHDTHSGSSTEGVRGRQRVLR